MTQRLHGKTAFVTAAGQGIGRATAVAFARQGAKVIATDIDAESLGSLKEEIDCTTHILNVVDGARIVDVAHQVGSVDILFNGAGLVHSGNLLECSEEDWTIAFDLNVRSQFRLIKAFLPGMLAMNSGSIINVASVVGALKGAPNRFVYGTTKAAVVGLTKSVAADFITKGIRCNAICPGTVMSPSLQERISAQSKLTGKSLSEVEAMFVDRQPMGRLGRVDEVANLAVYLASDESTFTTGTTQIIDGGWSN